MNKLFLNSRIEIIFSLSLVAILGLPPLVLAQTTKSIEIKITNGDTTINGKDIKKLSPAERKDALGEMDKMGNITFKRTDKGGNSDIVIRRNKRMGDEKSQDVVVERHMFNDGNMPFSADQNDNARKTFKYRIKKLKGADSTTVFSFNDSRIQMGNDGGLQFNDDMEFDNNRPMRFDARPTFRGPRRRPGGEFVTQGSQVFQFSSVDKDGINTSVSFMVSPALKEDIKRLAGLDKAGLQLTDLTLTPEFSTGKTTLSFNLDAKTGADIKLTDSDGKLLFSDKAINGSFSKKISLPRNGIYFLTVKQGANVAVKRIVKE